MKILPDKVQKKPKLSFTARRNFVIASVLMFTVMIASDYFWYKRLGLKDYNAATDRNLSYQYYLRAHDRDNLCDLFRSNEPLFRSFLRPREEQSS